MFANCKNITRGPDLPALTTVTGCYVNMFNGCSKLNYIKCLNEGNSGTNYTSAWLYKVSSTGTFVKSANKNDWTRDHNGIPSGWTVIEDNSIIYELYNHVCDGTAATCINTGIFLLSEQFAQEHPCFSVELGIDIGANDTNPAKAHIIRCNNQNSPYTGFYVRRSTSGSGYLSKFDNISGANVYSEILQPNQMSNLKFIFNAGNNSFSVERDNTIVYNNSYNLFYNSIPFIIGGNLNDITDESQGWKEIWKGTITHLIIRDINP